MPTIKKVALIQIIRAKIPHKGNKTVPIGQIMVKTTIKLVAMLLTLTNVVLTRLQMTNKAQKTTKQDIRSQHNTQWTTNCKMEQRIKGK